MNFAQKLDLFMTITRTTNRELGDYLLIDPSQVSRVRNGRRRPGGCFQELMKMADFFALKLKENYQLAAIQKALELPFQLPDDSEELRPVLAGILHDQKRPELLSEADNQSHLQPSGSETGGQAAEVPVQLYFGEAGTEAAKIQFLKGILQEHTPRMVSLFNNDDMAWMKNDSHISHVINDMSSRMFALGHRMQVILTAERNFQQLRSLVDVWMPLILERYVEVFYYPGKVDGLFRRHISIMNGVHALTSTAVGEMGQDKMTMIVRDKRMVKALQKEYDQLLYLSKPLFNIYQADNENQMLQDITQISKEEAPTFRYADPLPGNTLPPAVFEKIHQRMNYRNKDRVARHYQNIYRYNEWNLHRVPTLEMVRLPDVEEVHAGRIPIEQSLYFPMDTIYYTPQEYAEHLRHILHLLERYPNYHLYLTDEVGPENYLLLIKKNMNVLVTSKRYPPMILNTREPLIVDIFWNHYMEKTNLESASPLQKRRVMKKLEQYLEQLV